MIKKIWTIAGVSFALSVFSLSTINHQRTSAWAETQCESGDPVVMMMNGMTTLSCSGNCTGTDACGTKVVGGPKTQHEANDANFGRGSGNAGLPEFSFEYLDDGGIIMDDDTFDNHLKGDGVTVVCSCDPPMGMMRKATRTEPRTR